MNSRFELPSTPAELAAAERVAVSHSDALSKAIGFRAHGARVVTNLIIWSGGAATALLSGHDAVAVVTLGPRSRARLPSDGGGSGADAHERSLIESAQPTIPVMIANTNAIVASHRMSRASVPSLAEIVESTLVPFPWTDPMLEGRAVSVRTPVGVNTLS